MDSDENRTVVPGLGTLKAMERAGLIRFHADTGKKVRHWLGPETTALYVDGVCEGVKRPFTYKGRRYDLKLFDGCWSLFVCDIDFAEAQGINLDRVMA